MIRTPKQGNHGNYQAIVFVDPGHFRIFQGTRKQVAKQAAAWKTDNLDVWIELGGVEESAVQDIPILVRARVR